MENPKDILSRFGVEDIRPLDQHINILPSKDDLSIFKSFDLAPYSYKEMIDVIIQEIVNRKKYILT